MYREGNILVVIIKATEVLMTCTIEYAPLTARLTIHLKYSTQEIVLINMPQTSRSFDIITGVEPFKACTLIPFWDLKQPFCCKYIYIVMFSFW